MKNDVHLKHDFLTHFSLKFPHFFIEKTQIFPVILLAIGGELIPAANRHKSHSDSRSMTQQNTAT